MSTYREELCNKDERGIPLFSPYCQPGRTIDVNLTKQVTSTYGDLNCHISPVYFPKPGKQFVDEKNSAKDWFKDPTYAEQVAMRMEGINIESNKNESLKLYNTQKTMERVSASLMQTL